MPKKNFHHRFIGCSITFFVCLLLMSSAAFASIEEHITKTETGFYYTIQKGDTLWDLSQEFSDSPWEWPELWHYNPELANPHRIYPGQKILLYKKEWEGKEKPEAVIVEKEPLQEIEKFYMFPSIDKVGFIRKEAVSPSGTIFKSEDDIKMITNNKLIYIHMESDTQVGDRFSIYRTYNDTKDPETGKYLGVHHMFTGMVEITEVQSDFALGRIIKNYIAIRVGDLLMPYRENPTKIIVTESNKNLTGKIIKTEYSEVVNLIGESYIVFIDKGDADGVMPGQFYKIFFQESAKPDPGMMFPVLLPPVEIGELMVLRTEKTTAAAVITDSKRSIEPGNKIRALLSP